MFTKGQRLRCISGEYLDETVIFDSYSEDPTKIWVRVRLRDDLEYEGCLVVVELKYVIDDSVR